MKNKGNLRSWAIVALISFSGMAMWSGCDLFGDDQYCQNETTESKIWQSGRDVNYAPGDTSVSFVFNRASKVEDRCFKVQNVCPFGVLVIRITVNEKGSILPPQANAYKALLVEVLPQSNVYRVRKLIGLYRQSPSVLQGQIDYTMLDLPENGPREFFVGVAATFPEGTFTNKLEMEDWAQAHVDQVVFESNFVRWQ